MATQGFSSLPNSIVPSGTDVALIDGDGLDIQRNLRGRTGTKDVMDCLTHLQFSPWTADYVRDRIPEIVDMVKNAMYANGIHTTEEECEWTRQILDRAWSNMRTA